MDQYALHAKGITKRYGEVLANDSINFSLKVGEVHSLLGENGAGKSTLVKILYGLVQQDEGEIFLNNKLVEFKSTAKAIENGIGMVHQELMLIPYMTVAENIVLGREITKGIGHLDSRRAEKELKELADIYGFNIDPAVPVYKLPIGVQQRVEIMKLLYRRANILILDEPTALLTPQEAEVLFEIIRSLKNQGKSIIFITHKLKEVYQITDRMSIMRSGKMIATTTPEETNEKQLAELMVGKNVTGLQFPVRKIDRSPLLEVKELSILSSNKVRALNSISFCINKGEILGVAGIEGNGQTQLAQALIGLIPVESGTITFGGESIANDSTARIRQRGIGSIPDDRQKEGLVLPFKIKENLFLNRFREKPYAKGFMWQDWSAINKSSQLLLNDFDIRAPDINTPVAALSGGNQQKVVVGRELAVKCKLLIASQPTRGVDFASAISIQQTIIEASQYGTSVLLISSDLDELLKISDRIMVLLRGNIVGIISAKNADRKILGRMMLGIEVDTEPESLAGDCLR
ncbi:MAG: ABC transporter ATP-binding protein [Christensenellales bacterium]